MKHLAFSQVVALVAFGGAYLGLALGRLPLFRVDRTGVAIIGAVAMVAGGVLPWDAAVAAVDVHTLALLFGMMIVAAYLRLSGFFVLVTAWTVRRARTPDALLGAMIVVSGASQISRKCGASHRADVLLKPRPRAPALRPRVGPHYDETSRTTPHQETRAH